MKKKKKVILVRKRVSLGRTTHPHVTNFLDVFMKNPQKGEIVLQPFYLLISRTPYDSNINKTRKVVTLNKDTVLLYLTIFYTKRFYTLST